MGSAAAIDVRAVSLDSLGCASEQLHNNLELSGDGIKFYRKRSLGDSVNPVATPGADRGYLVGVAMGHGHRRRILHEHHSSMHEFEKGAVYIRNFVDPYRAEMEGPLDFMLMEISPDFLERTIEERSGVRIRSLECVTALKDPVLVNLAAAVAPSLDRPHESSTLFIDQMGVAIATYLVEYYGGGAPRAPRKSRTMSRQHEERAKEMLRQRLDGGISIADVAEACSLSRSYFIRAFRETTGLTPHQWLMAQRIEQARGMLTDPALSLAEIATRCGFSDQSHFTRAFTQTTGVSPGQWRRQATPARWLSA